MILILLGEAGLGRGLARGLVAGGETAEVDLDVDLGSMRDVRRVIHARRPAAVVLAECWDDPEANEAEPERSFLLNAEGPIHLAAACLEHRAVPILLSSPEVFGQRGGPWIESDEPQPRSEWAKARRRGEELFLRAAPQGLLVRAGPILSDGLERERRRLDGGPLEEASDEEVVPIEAEALGRSIAGLLAVQARGVFHASGPGAPLSRAELWRVLALRTGHAAERVRSRPGREIAGRVYRPRAALLDAAKLSRVLKAAPARAPVELAETKEGKMGHKQDVRRVDKPWGHEIIWAHTDRYVGKVLFVKAGERLSLQYHERKDETVYVLSGKMVFEVGERDGPREDLVLKAGDAYRITPLTTHRMIALEDTHILEASTPELDDVVRLEDKYGRAGTKAP